MGIEHSGEKAKGEGTNTKGEVESPGITEWLEPLGRQGRSGKPTGLGTGRTQLDKETHPSALWSWSLALRAGWSFQSERKERQSALPHPILGQKPSAPLSIVSGLTWDPAASGFLAHKEGPPSPC